MEMRTNDGTVVFDFCPGKSCTGIVDTGTSFIAVSQDMLDAVTAVVGVLDGGGGGAGCV